MTDRPDRTRPDLEDRLRAAIHHRTEAVEPSPGGLTRIEEKLMDEPTVDRRQRGWLIGLSSAAAIIAIVIGVLVLTDGDDDQKVDQAGPSSTLATSSTSSSTTTSTSVIAAPNPAQTVWPDPSSSQRFDDPVAAARSFASDLVGMTAPIVGDFMQADSRSGEVEIRAFEQGPVTLAFVRQLEDDSWFVIGAATEDIVLDSPDTGEQVACPISLTGSALAFEGTVGVRVYTDGVQEPIGTGFVTGGGDIARPFEGSVDCDQTQVTGSPAYGSIVLTSEGGEDGAPISATVVRVRLA